MLDDILHFTADGQFSLVGRRGRVVKIEDKRISLDDIERRLLALDGIREAAALTVTRGGRQGIGVLLVLNEAVRQQHEQGKSAGARPATRPSPGLNRLPCRATGGSLMKSRSTA